MCTRVEVYQQTFFFKIFFLNITFTIIAVLCISNVQSLLFCVYYVYNHCCFVYITCTIIAVLCILHVQSMLFCVYYMYNHCCIVYITCTLIAMMYILQVQSVLFCVYYRYINCFSVYYMYSFCCFVFITCTITAVFRSPESLRWPIAMGWRPSSCVVRRALTSSPQKLLRNYWANPNQIWYVASVG